MAITPFKVTDFVPIESSYATSYMINTNLPILHRFLDIAFDGSKIAIFGYPSFV